MIVKLLLALLLSHNVTVEQVGFKRFATFWFTVDAPLTQDYAADFVVNYNKTDGQETRWYHIVVPAGAGTNRSVITYPSVPADFSVANYTISNWGPVSTETNQ